ncbi:MAG: hypothetical protein P8186_00555 [Anaerolineae bacterium]
MDCRSSLVLSSVLLHLQQVGCTANPSLASRPGSTGYLYHDNHSNASSYIQRRAAVDFNAWWPTISNFGQRRCVITNPETNRYATSHCRSDHHEQAATNADTHPHDIACVPTKRHTISHFDSHPYTVSNSYAERDAITARSPNLYPVSDTNTSANLYAIPHTNRYANLHTLPAPDITG